jgi:hypothetical protein
VPTKNGKQTAAELRRGLRKFEKDLFQDRDEAAARCVRRTTLGVEHDVAHQEWLDWQLALSYLATWTNGEFGVPLGDQPSLPEPLPVYQLRSDACPGCQHQGRTFTTSTRLYGCPDCSHTSTGRHA